MVVSLKTRGAPAEEEDEDKLLDFHQAVSEVMEAEERIIEEHRLFIQV
jgi:hypothetical protein